MSQVSEGTSLRGGRGRKGAGLGLKPGSKLLIVPFSQAAWALTLFHHLCSGHGSNAWIAHGDAPPSKELRSRCEC